MSRGKEQPKLRETVTIRNLLKAWKTVSSTCKNKKQLLLFSLRLYGLLATLQKELLTGTYVPDPYYCSLIFEPKPRLVMSQSIRDKIVNHLVAEEFLLPICERSLIDTNVATRKGKGSAAAMKMLKKYFAQMLESEKGRAGRTIYALKVDVSKYFYTIDHEILFEKLRKKIRDPEILRLLEIMIRQTDAPYVNEEVDRLNLLHGLRSTPKEIPHYQTGKGLSIGAMVSQFLAIFFLSSLDHYIKENLHCRYYVRYMDDFVILDFDKRRLQMTFDVIAGELEKLGLSVNPKSRIYNCSDGFIFLGYRYHINRSRNRLEIRCSAKTVRKIRRRLRTLREHDPEKYQRSLASYQGYFKAARRGHDSK